MPAAAARPSALTSTTYTQHCRLVLGPPNFGLSRQLIHSPQSSSIKQPLQLPQRRDRTPPTVYRLRIFLFLNLWPFPLPLRLRWMFSWETTHWALPLSVRSSSSSATSGGERQRGWVKEPQTAHFKHLHVNLMQTDIFGIPALQSAGDMACLTAVIEDGYILIFWSSLVCTFNVDTNGCAKV